MKISIFYLLVGILSHGFLYCGHLVISQHLLRKLLFPWIAGPPPAIPTRENSNYDENDTLDVSIGRRSRRAIESRKSRCNSDGVESNDLYDDDRTNGLLSTNPEDIRFYLYPDYNNWNYSEEILSGCFNSLYMTQYNSKLPLLVLIHGFGGEDTTPERENEVLRNAYLEVHYPANIVGMDWGRLSNPNIPPSFTSYAFYGGAYRNVEIAAQQLAYFVQFLIQSKKLEGPGNTHFVGFSLGAQVAARAGHKIKKFTGRKISRLTGLDPAGPLFYFLGNDGKLDHDDAEFVDVTHTSAGLFGYYGVIGHVDFYINGGGPNQPGCSRNIISNLRDGCPHVRAFQHFADSIRYTMYMGCKCKQNDCQETPKGKCVGTLYGQYCDTRKRGSYYVNIPSN